MIFKLFSFCIFMAWMILQMGDASVEVSDENREASQTAKSKAVEAISEGILLII